MLLQDLKLEKWDKVVEDCNEVFKHEKNNVKALLRRSTAYFKKKKYEEALNDVETCIKIEPTNKKALVCVSNFISFLCVTINKF